VITITPQGSVYLCKTPLENDYKNQLTFDNATSQQTYFNSKVVTSETDYTYIKKDNTMVVGKPIDDIISCNYLFYKNTGFTNRYYYCFITNMEYVNENATRITIETDVYQTYMFDIIKKACFVEREHVNDDTIGVNTTHEGIDTGEFIVNEVNYFDENSSGAHVIVGVSALPEELRSQTITFDKRNYNGIYSGLYYIVCASYLDASKLITIMDIEGLAENVYSVFLSPMSLYNTTSWSTFTKHIDLFEIDITVSYKMLPETNEATLMATESVDINTTLNGYTPKNNKLFTKEFNYMYVTNNNGGNVEMAYEDFIDNEPLFHIIGSVCPGCSIKLIPDNYKKYDTTYPNYKNYMYDFGLTGAKYPTCSWASDSYTNWLTQQGVDHAFGQIGNVATLGVLMASGNPLGVALGGVSIIKDVLTENLKRETSPIQAKGNINGGDVSFSASRTCFTVYQMSMKYEFAKRIDDYFSMFGYKVNEVKIPNTTGRTNWNYVKTIDCNFEGDIPQMYLNKIKEIFNNGITLWHNGSTFLDYSQSNNIVS